MTAQLELALDNLEEVLTEAGMTFADVVRLNAYTTDLDGLLQRFPAINARFGDSRLRDEPARRRAAAGTALGHARGDRGRLISRLRSGRARRPLVNAACSDP